MVSDIPFNYVPISSLTLALASLASGLAMQSVMVSNPSGYPAALVYLKVFAGGLAHVQNSICNVYLLRGDQIGANFRTDNAGLSTASINIQNATKIGSILFASLISVGYPVDFDTSVAGPLGAEWGIAVQNQTSAPFGGTEGNHLKEFTYYVPEVRP